MKTLVLNFRDDLAPLVTLLAPHFTILTQQELCLGRPDPPPEFPGLPFQVAEGWWPVVGKTIDGILELEDLVGVLVWNSVQPATRALALAARHRGLPAFEVDHGCFATYLHGHFESDPASTHIFSSPEEAAFLRAYGYTGELYETGRPFYDFLEKMTPQEGREALGGLPVHPPLVLRTTTWTHGMSRWSDFDSVCRDAEVSFLQAMKTLRKAIPFTLVYTIRAGMGWNPKAVSEDLKLIGLDDSYVTTEHGLAELIPAADCVVSPKGSAAAEAVLMDRPALIVDFRPQLDTWAWEKKGIRAARAPEEIAPLVLRALADEEFGEELRLEREAGKLWFNGPGEATQAIAEEIIRVCSGH